MSDLAQSTLLAILVYDKDSGVFIWKNRPPSTFIDGSKHSKEDICARWNKRFAHEVAGWKDQYGYLNIGIGGKSYLGSRLAWLYVTGCWPERDIDHQNRIPGDNSWKNLREATESQNLANSAKPITNTSGYKGVYWSSQRLKWVSKITVRRKTIYLGSYDYNDKILAVSAYAAAAKKYFGEFAHAG